MMMTARMMWFSSFFLNKAFTNQLYLLLLRMVMMMASTHVSHLLRLTYYILCCRSQLVLVKRLFFAKLDICEGRVI
ncbi:hypothetical protein P615_02640 [Brevibacillus laterosporus PE36]|nr:hypothetical protein P615_02640 [Brevibacillus laterosporus PE36]